MTDMIAADETVLKSDGLGRLRTPPQRREQLLDEFERSGLSGIKFAALVGIKYPTFAAWLAKRRRQRQPAANAAIKAAHSVRWLEAVVEQAQNGDAQNAHHLVLELAGGARVQISHSQQAVLAAALLRALQKEC